MFSTIRGLPFGRLTWKLQQPEHPHETGWEINWWDHKTKPQMTKNRQIQICWEEAGRLESYCKFFLSRVSFIWRVESSIGTRCDISSQRTFSAGVEAQSQEWQRENFGIPYDGWCLLRDGTNGLDRMIPTKEGSKVPYLTIFQPKLSLLIVQLRYTMIVFILSYPFYGMEVGVWDKLEGKG